MTKGHCLGGDLGVFMGFVIRSTDTTAINGIRQLVSVNIDGTVLSDSLITSNTFLRAAEFAVYRKFEKDGSFTDQSYLTKIGFSGKEALYVILDRFPENFNYRGDYTSLTNMSFNINDIVYQGSPPNLYYANKIISNAPGTLNTDDWVQINVIFKGDWNSGTNTSFNQYDVVYQGSNLYVAKSSFTKPGSFTSANWDQIQQLDHQFNQ